MNELREQLAKAIASKQNEISELKRDSDYKEQQVRQNRSRTQLIEAEIRGIAMTVAWLPKEEAPAAEPEKKA